MNADAVYLHVPFCIHRCGYCDFTVISGRDDLIEGYLDSLELEISRTLSEPQLVSTIFIGGGTPSYLPESALERLIMLTRKWFPLREAGEFSAECNPEGFSTSKMEILRAGGVNRISLGVQSFHEPHLKTLERTHTPETVDDVFERLRNTGFSNISLDLIFAVPNQTLDQWQDDLSAAVNLSPMHISTYGLTFEKGTQFWTRRMKSELIPADDDLEREMYALSMTALQAAGYHQYELSNFARPGFESRHNQVYWNIAPYFGFGPGAASFLNGIREMRHRSVTTWIRRIQEGKSGIADSESLDLEGRAREAVMLGLRQTKGISLKDFEDRFSTSLCELAPDAFDRLIDQGLLESDSESVRLTLAGRFLADSVVAEFL